MEPAGEGSTILISDPEGVKRICETVLMQCLNLDLDPSGLRLCRPVRGKSLTCRPAFTPYIGSLTRARRS